MILKYAFVQFAECSSSWPVLEAPAGCLAELINNRAPGSRLSLTIKVTVANETLTEHGIGH